MAYFNLLSKLTDSKQGQGISMSLVTQFKFFADYNQLMNQRLYEAASRLSKEQLHNDKGAFFGSVLATLNHILVGDIIWLKRFATHAGSSDVLRPVTERPKPERLDSILFHDLAVLNVERETLDLLINNWVANLVETDLDDVLAYNDTKGDLYNKPYSSLISHLFLHQVHHRGQVTTLLSQCGVDFGDTDIIEIVN